MNTTTATEYLTETKFRNAVKKVLGGVVNSKAQTDRGFGHGVNVTNAEGHWEKDATHFRVEPARHSGWELVEVERALVLAGFEMVEYAPAYLQECRVNIAWRKAA